MMKQRPILFQGAMVRALLNGSKTQTRRIVKPQPDSKTWLENDVDGSVSWHNEGPPCCGTGAWEVPEYSGKVKCPYGQPGDQLWVRESFSGPWCMEAQDGHAAAPPSKWGESSRIWYWADGEPAYGDWTRPRPSIHMPCWASRITLEITGVRVERLQDISEADADAECFGGDFPSNVLPELFPGTADDWGHLSMAQCYQRLWEAINGAGSWDANPWVWCLSFKRVPQC